MRVLFFCAMWCCVVLVVGVKGKREEERSEAFKRAGVEVDVFGFRAKIYRHNARGYLVI